MRSQDILSLFEKRLKKPLPGFAAQSYMMPIPRPGHRDINTLDDDYIEAGILILLYLGPHRLNVLLTKRTDRVFHHRDQISFPGGRREPHETLEETALREAQEELGIALETARVLGRLTPLFIPPSKYCVHPFIAAVEERPDFHPQSEEVAEVIEIPLDHLLDEENIHREVWTIRGLEVEVPFYEYQKHKIWGATAMVLAEFLAIWKTVSGRKINRE